MNARCSRGTYTLGYRHNCIVVYQRRLRELWRKSYWVVCIYCDEVQGPHRAANDAWKVADAFNALDTFTAGTTRTEEQT